MYDRTSLASLQADRALLVEQIDDLEKHRPHHPKLGHWKGRITRIEQVMGEILDAERRIAAEDTAVRPRAGLTPHDEALSPVGPDIPTSHTMRQRRRKARLHARRGFVRRGLLVTQRGLDQEEMAKAQEALTTIQVGGYPLFPDALARRIGVPILRLYNSVALCERLWAHNRAHRDTLVARMLSAADGLPLTDPNEPNIGSGGDDEADSSARMGGVESLMEAYLVRLRADGRRADHADLATLCGLSKRQFFNAYPNWCRRVKEHNQSIEDEAVVERAKARLAVLVKGETAEPVKVFAKNVRSDPGKLRDRCPAIIRALKAHNRSISPQGCHALANEGDEADA